MSHNVRRSSFWQLAKNIKSLSCFISLSLHFKFLGAKIWGGADIKCPTSIILSNTRVLIFIHLFHKQYFSAIWCKWLTVRIIMAEDF